MLLQALLSATLLVASSGAFGGDSVLVKSTVKAAVSRVAFARREGKEPPDLRLLRSAADGQCFDNYLLISLNRQALSSLGVSAESEVGLGAGGPGCRGTSQASNTTHVLLPSFYTACQTQERATAYHGRLSLRHNARPLALRFSCPRPGQRHRHNLTDVLQHSALALELEDEEGGAVWHDFPHKLPVPGSFRLRLAFARPVPGVAPTPRLCFLSPDHSPDRTALGTFPLIQHGCPLGSRSARRRTLLNISSTQWTFSLPSGFRAWKVRAEVFLHCSVGVCEGAECSQPCGAPPSEASSAWVSSGPLVPLVEASEAVCECAAFPREEGERRAAGALSVPTVAGVGVAAFLLGVGLALGLAAVQRATEPKTLMASAASARGGRRRAETRRKASADASRLPSVSLRQTLLSSDSPAPTLPASHTHVSPQL